MSARHLALRHAEIAAGESVYAAMLRVGDLSGDVWAVDLSGDPVVFASGPGPGPCADLLVRPMSEADLSSLVVWQTMPHVSRWWGDRPRTLGELRAQAGPALAGEGDARLWMVEVNGRPVGFLEDRPVGAGAALPTAAAHDVHIYAAIGDPALVGKGVGTRVVWTFLRDVVQPAHPGAALCVAAPDHRNEAALRMLDKVGFTRGPWFDHPRGDGTVATLVECRLDLAEVLTRHDSAA